MGSLDRAVLSGFICRLCSEMHRIVVHIYGDEGTRLNVPEKINRYLSINVSVSDPLPKTICCNCLDRLENQHRLVQRIELATSLMKDKRRLMPSRSTCYIGMCQNNAHHAPIQ